MRSRGKYNKKLIVFGIVFNACITLAFVGCNIVALQAGLEETFVALALIYGVVVMVGNAVLMSFYSVHT